MADYHSFWQFVAFRMLKYENYLGEDPNRGHGKGNSLQRYYKHI
jgi:hypothetical protein